MTEADAAAVLAIYQAGIDEGDATFETQAPAWPEFTATRLPGHRYVARNGADVLGWVAVSPVSQPVPRLQPTWSSTRSTCTQAAAARA